MREGVRVGGLLAAQVAHGGVEWWDILVWNEGSDLLRVRIWVREVCNHHGVSDIGLMRVAQAGEAQVLGERAGSILSEWRDW